MPMKSSCKRTPGWRHQNEKNCRTLDHLDRSRLEADRPTATAGGYLAEGRWRSPLPGADPDDSPRPPDVSPFVVEPVWTGVRFRDEPSRRRAFVAPHVGVQVVPVRLGRDRNETFRLISAQGLLTMAGLEMACRRRTLRLDVVLLTVLDLPRPDLPPTVARPPETLGRNKPGHCGIVQAPTLDVPERRIDSGAEGRRLPGMCALGKRERSPVAAQFRTREWAGGPADGRCSTCGTAPSGTTTGDDVGVAPGGTRRSRAHRGVSDAGCVDLGNASRHGACPQ